MAMHVSAAVQRSQWWRRRSRLVVAGALAALVLVAGVGVWRGGASSAPSGDMSASAAVPAPRAAEVSADMVPSRTVYLVSSDAEAAALTEALSMREALRMALGADTLDDVVLAVGAREDVAGVLSVLTAHADLSAAMGGTKLSFVDLRR